MAAACDPDGTDPVPVAAGRFLTPDQVAEELNVSRSQTTALLS